MTPRRTVTLLACALAASLLRCAKDPTGFYVTVTVPATVPAIRFLQVRLMDTASVTTATQPTGGPPPGQIGTPTVVMLPTAGPYTFVVTRTGRYSRITIEVTGAAIQFAPGQLGVAYDRATVTFVDDALFDVTMNLRAFCMGSMPCPGTQRCSAATPSTCVESTNPTMQRHQW